MANDPISGNFVNPAYASPEQIAAQRQYAKYLTENQMPVTGGRGGWAIGLANALSAGMGGLEAGRADRAQRQAQGGATDQMTGLIQMLQGGGANTAQPQGQPQVSDNTNPYAKALSGIESGGKYDAVGPTVRSGDRAYGKYQVMGNNVPAWTQEILGQKMSPQEFLKNPEAQEKVFNGKFGQYLQQTGNPQDAASMWFSGKPAAQSANLQAHDPTGKPIGITGAQYVQQFNGGLGGNPVQMASLGNGMQPPNGAPQPQGGPQVAQMLPQATQVAQAPQQQGMDPRLAAQVLTNPWMPAAASKMVGERLAPSELKVITDSMGDQVPYWANHANQTLTPAFSGSNSGGPSQGGLSPQTFQNITEARDKGATQEQLLQMAPVQLRESVSAMLRGDELPANLSPRGNTRNNVMMLAHTIDKNFDETKIPMRVNFAKGMAQSTPSSIGGQVNGSNTIVKHAGDAYDALSVINQGKLAPSEAGSFTNSFKSALRTQLGDKSFNDAMGKWETARGGVANELGRILTGGEGSDSLRNFWLSRLDINQPPAKLKSSLDEAMELMRGRLTSIANQKTMAYGRPTSEIDLLSPENQAIAKKIFGGTVRGQQQEGTAQPGAQQQPPSAVQKWERKPDGSIGPAQ